VVEISCRRKSRQHQLLLLAEVVAPAPRPRPREGEQPPPALLVSLRQQARKSSIVEDQFERSPLFVAWPNLWRCCTDSLVNSRRCQRELPIKEPVSGTLPHSSWLHVHPKMVDVVVVMAGSTSHRWSLTSTALVHSSLGLSLETPCPLPLAVLLHPFPSDPVNEESFEPSLRTSDTATRSHRRWLAQHHAGGVRPLPH
jgi:hypothetical protein